MNDNEQQGQRKALQDRHQHPYSRRRRRTSYRATHSAQEQASQSKESLAPQENTSATNGTNRRQRQRQRRQSRDIERQAGTISTENSQAPKNVRLLRPHRILFIGMSVFLALFSVAMPYLSSVANGFQSQSLYTGYMFTQGTLPYADIYSTGGLLYYALIAISYLLGSSAWLLVINVLAFYVSGVYLYKIITYLTGRRDAAVGLVSIFYLLNYGLGFGGLYPIQWAMPFIFLSVWYLVKYFDDATTDEAFVIYGFTGALGLLIEPRTMLFWIISFMVILGYSFYQRRFARGIYQALGTIFGSLLVIYTAVYFILNLQILSGYINQAGFGLLTNFAIATNNVFLTFIYQLAMAAASGLLIGFLALSKRSAYANKHRFIKVVLMVMLVTSLFPVLLSQTFQLYDLLLLLPYGIILASVVVTTTDEMNEETMVGQDSPFVSYFTHHFYLPYIVVILGVLFPLVSSLMQMGTARERTTVANYIRQNTTTSDSIYVWDNNASVYLISQRRAASHIILPTVNNASTSNQQLLNDELLQNAALYVVVNNTQQLTTEISKDLSSNYDLVSVDQINHFTIYRKKA